MSTLLKFLLMALAWVVLYLASFHGCIKPEYCPDDGAAITEAVTPPPPAAVADDYSIVSTLRSTDVETGTRWAAERADLLRQYQADPSRLLEVTGLYYGSEAKPANFENMGLLRAERIKDLLVAQTAIPADKIVTTGRRLDGTPAASPWDAGNFRFKDAVTAANAQDAEVIELDEFTKIILFPYNSATKDIDPKVDAYLVKLAKRMQQTNEKVTLVGHTDDRGRPEYNQKLGQRRADFVKSILTRNGASAANITTRSRGESDPRVPNTTPANMHQNRRVVVTLVQ